MIGAKFQTGAALLDAWRHDLWEGTPPERWPLGPGALATDIDFGPGQVLVIGGAPGAGKTALATAAIFDALRVTPDLRALIVNVEMPPSALLDRQLARLSGIRLDTIAARELRKLGAAGRERIEGGLVALAPLLDRVAFLEPPYALEHAATAADEFGARCILLDYVQRISPPGDRGSQRENLEAAMDCIRKMAQAGAGVLTLSAVARQKGTSGSDYKGLGLASLRGSSELEFAADSVYALSEGDDTGAALLKCCKRRNGEPKDLHLRFERDCQRFTPAAQATYPANGATPEGTYEDDDAPF